MSRIGRQIISVPEEVEIKIVKGEISVKGKKGELKQVLPDFLRVVIKDGKLSVGIKNIEDKKQKSLWGTMNRLIFNMIKGVTDGFEKRLELVGIGYKAEVKDNKLILRLGFSHPIEYTIPSGIEIVTDKNLIIITGINKQRVGDVAAKIRHFREPEPYKGKGVKYVDEVIRRKAGKRAVSAGD
ncbi:50S ribosomal protein L6 [bacterium]|nr:50S ribosomal protein L6 [bacterium]